MQPLADTVRIVNNDNNINLRMINISGRGVIPRLEVVRSDPSGAEGRTKEPYPMLDDVQIHRVVFSQHGGKPVKTTGRAHEEPASAA